MNARTEKSQILRTGQIVCLRHELTKFGHFWFSLEAMLAFAIPCLLMLTTYVAQHVVDEAAENTLPIKKRTSAKMLMSYYQQLMGSCASGNP